MKTMSAPRSAKPSPHAEDLRKRAIIDLENRPVLPAVRRSVAGIEGELTAMEERAKIPGLVPKADKVLAWIAEARENIHTDDWMKSKGEVAIAASKGDAEAGELMAATVLVTTENIVHANTGWASFFEERELADDEQPAIQAEVLGQQITIDSIGQDGGRQTVRSQLNSPAPVFLPINLYGTPWFEYPLADLYKGHNVKEMALAQFDVARDKAWRRETLLGSYLIVGGANSRYVASFVTTGSLAARDYFPDDRVNTDNLPAGNLITISGNSTSSLFRKEVFDAIATYCRSWGDNVMEGGNLRPVEIRLPSKNVTDFLSQVTLSSVENLVVNQIFANGFVMTYGGYTWIITGDNTLRPNDGVCYVRTGLPIGIAYNKPSFDQVIQDDSKVLLSQNKGRTCETWAEAFALPLHWRKRTLAVRYRTAS
jgi:hypothetical protein